MTILLHTLLVPQVLHISEKSETPNGLHQLKEERLSLRYGTTELVQMPKVRTLPIEPEELPGTLMETTEDHTLELLD